MQHYILCPKSGGLFLFSDFKDRSFQNILGSSALYKMVYNRGTATHVYVDNKRYTLKQNEILFCKPLNSLEIVASQEDLKVMALNKDVYKPNTIAEESDFYSFWFFGVQHPHKIVLSSVEQSFYELMFDSIQREFEQFNGAIETQRDILKRIVRVTGIREQTAAFQPILSTGQLSVIKKFNQLIEAHFNKKASFEDITKMLTKSPSFISQLLNKYFGNSKRPQLTERILTESRQLELRRMISGSLQIERPNTVFFNSRLNNKNSQTAYTAQDVVLNQQIQSV